MTSRDLLGFLLSLLGSNLEIVDLCEVRFAIFHSQRVLCTTFQEGEQQQ